MSAEPRAVKQQIMAEPVEQTNPKKVKWHSMQHSGPIFAPAYERLPKDVNFYYDNEMIELTEQAEEVATFYVKALTSPHAQHPEFIENFFGEFRKCLSIEQRHLVREFELRVANYRIRPPGLSCPRSTKSAASLTMGMIKARVLPEDVTINCDELLEPPAPPAGHHWHQILHDHSVQWLYAWRDSLSGKMVYVHAKPEIPKVLAEPLPSREQFETARIFQTRLIRMRRVYNQIMISPELQMRQLGVALYCIDHLGMDPVDLCAMRVDQVKLQVRLGERKNIWHLLPPLKPRQHDIKPGVYYNLSVFIDGKQPHEPIFSELTVEKLQENLRCVMDGLTPAVFRICNASSMLAEQLETLKPDAKHEWLQGLIALLKEILEQYDQPLYREVVGQFSRLSIKRERRLRQLTNHAAALLQSTAHFVDPRIIVSWCLRHKLDIDKLYKTTKQRKTIKWALDSATMHFRF
ncbi:DNA topoisomerase 1-like [Drosophila busckii]|uniref:DNA topoisomerase 1-like n=1 Tax=Drosophila busckii TaxID=30019 RepID=UPI00083EBE64|nr:DNA topoisomerase 1-like [Drosophila busckii]